MKAESSERTGEAGLMLGKAAHTLTPGSDLRRERLEDRPPSTDSMGVTLTTASRVSGYCKFSASVAAIPYKGKNEYSSPPSTSTIHSGLSQQAMGAQRKPT